MFICLSYENLSNVVALIAGFGHTVFDRLIFLMTVVDSGTRNVDMIKCAQF